MADLGAIGEHHRTHFPRVLDVWAATHALAVPQTSTPAKSTTQQPLYWWGTPPLWLVDRFESLSGEVRKYGVLTAGVRVRLHHRATGLAVAETTTAADGTYTFDNLPSDVSAYYAVAFDPAGSENALVLDRLTPA